MGRRIFGLAAVLVISGATIDNTTNDPSAQFMPYLFAIA